MKKLFTTAMITLAACFALQLNAQIKTPAASTAATFTQTVGLTEISMKYSRPGVKGRTIFADDGLVPYGKVWRTAANAATKITFSDDVTIEGKELAEGSYAILTIPNATSWDVSFYEYDKTNFTSYLEAEPAATVTVTPQTLPFSVENFFFAIADIKDDGAKLEIIWDNVLVPMNIGVGTDETVMAAIDNVMSGPSANDYYAAGMYYYRSGKDKMKALEWVQKATSQGEPKFWQKKWEAEILASIGKTKEAIKAAKLSRELAEKAGNSDYVKMNDDNIAKWNM